MARMRLRYSSIDHPADVKDYGWHSRRFIKVIFAHTLAETQKYEVTVAMPPLVVEPAPYPAPFPTPELRGVAGAAISILPHALKGTN